MKKIAVPLLIIAVAIMGLLIVTGGSVDAAKRPSTVDIKKEFNLTDDAVSKLILSGWSLGGVYPDCGEGSGEIMITGDLGAAMLPLYVSLQERNQAEMLALLKKQFPGNADEKLKKIVSGKDKITNYGGTDQYISLQDDFDNLDKIVKELGESPKAEGVLGVDDLIAALEKFVKDGKVEDVNAAKKAIKAVQKIIEKNPDKLVSGEASTSENIAKLERLRKAVGDSLAKIDKLGGSGCRTAYVFYKVR